MNNLVDEALMEMVLKQEHGFHQVEKAAKQIWGTHTPDEVKTWAFNLYEDPLPQKRMLAVFLLGYLSVEREDILLFLRDTVSQDENWRVQEVLAKAFDYYCEATGYKDAVSTIEEWLSCENPNTKRAVIEGLRIWTDRGYFKDHPEKAIEIISSQKNNPSEYLRKAVGNSLRDIKKRYPELIEVEVGNWDQNDRLLKLVITLINKK